MILDLKALPYALCWSSSSDSSLICKTQGSASLTLAKEYTAQSIGPGLQS